MDDLSIDTENKKLKEIRKKDESNLLISKINH